MITKVEVWSAQSGGYHSAPEYAALMDFKNKLSEKNSDSRTCLGDNPSNMSIEALLDLLEMLKEFENDLKMSGYEKTE